MKNYLFLSVLLLLVSSAAAQVLINGQTISSNYKNTEEADIQVSNSTFTASSSGIIATNSRITVTSSSFKSSSQLSLTTGSFHSVNYDSGGNGYINGISNQRVFKGQDSEAVTATPAAGSTFVMWSDGSVNPTRVIENVQSDISLKAYFQNGPPLVTNTYPSQNGAIYYTPGISTSIIFNFDPSSNIDLSSIRLYKVVNGVYIDVTSMIQITASGILYDLLDPLDVDITFVLFLNNGSSSQVKTLNLTTVEQIDKTVADVDSGSFNQPFTINLSTANNYKIYYSTDGYPPVPGAANTTEALETASINISHTTILHYFYIDPAGNREDTVNSRAYIFADNPAIPQNLTAAYDVNTFKITVNWQDPANIGKYRIYRAMNSQDKSILEAARSGAYAAPAALRIAELTSKSYIDSDLQADLTYSYAVTSVDIHGNESPLSNIFDSTVQLIGTAPDKATAVNKAKLWLLGQQNPDATWGAESELKILETSQAILALAKHGVQGLQIDRAKVVLNSLPADNNDSLCRQIIATSTLYNRMNYALLLFSLSGNGSGWSGGWGQSQLFRSTSLNTALALKALSALGQNIENNTDYNYHKLKNREFPYISNTGHGYSYVYNGAPSIAVSSLVYSITNNQAAAGWITQQANGSYNNSIADTCSVLLNLDISPLQRTAAENYLLNLQQPGGHWGDTYTTALCLEALGE